MIDHPFNRKAQLASAVKRSLTNEETDEFEFEAAPAAKDDETEWQVPANVGDNVDLCTFMSMLEAKLVDPPEKPPVTKYSTKRAPMPPWMKNRSLLPLKPPTKTGRP